MFYENRLSIKKSVISLFTCFVRIPARNSPSAFSRRAVVSYWRKYVHEVLVNRLGGQSLPRKSVVRLTDHPDMTLDVYCGRETTMQQQQQTRFCEPYHSNHVIPHRDHFYVEYKRGISVRLGSSVNFVTVHYL